MHLPAVARHPRDTSTTNRRIILDRPPERLAITFILRPNDLSSGFSVPFEPQQADVFIRPLLRFSLIMLFTDRYAFPTLTFNVKFLSYNNFIRKT